ncbi:DUF1828 domain-containing protein [Lactobacillus kefiranofaciens]|uniref:DUF1828 domain-containing protein n=1 Tax=Lactobacillus kefiranofaciens TaxID=267818 RepID=UPI002469A916|nr:DUF1828 domain-containing protein [Lactobacillus kefiranofaciens]MDH5100141.1 DUF1828 domain-containing protein [Lactobacillus kefiranofaciens]
MNKKERTEQLNMKIGAYVATETKTIWVDEHTMQIATIMIDAYGDTVYVWAEDHGDYWRITDGGRILFKLDPKAEDKELNETAQDIAYGSGYEFDPEHYEIYVDVAQENVAQVVMKLAQLEVAISYLG